MGSPIITHTEEAHKKGSVRGPLYTVSYLRVWEGGGYDSHYKGAYCQGSTCLARELAEASGPNGALPVVGVKGLGGRLLMLLLQSLFPPLLLFLRFLLGALPNSN